MILSKTIIMGGTGTRKGEIFSKIFGIGLVFVMVGSMVGGLPALVREAGASLGTIYVPDDYPTIQQAVTASGGGTVIVRDGTYHENVDVNVAHLTIQSQNGSANCAVVAADSDDHVFEVTADWVNITGFTVQNAAGNSMAGIYLGSTDHCNISSNNVASNYWGIYLYESSNNNLINNAASWNSYGDGIYLKYSDDNTLTNNTALGNSDGGISLRSSSNNTIASNTANSNDDGIRLYDSSNNNLINNTANSNDWNGISLSSSSNNDLINNTVNWNGWGVQLSSSNYNLLRNNIAEWSDYFGIHLGSSSNNDLINNTASNNYWGIELDQHSSSNNLINNTVNSNNDYGIHLGSSSGNNYLSNNAVNENLKGLYLSHSDYNTFTNNNASNNWRGIYLYYSDYNTFTKNNASNNTGYGIYLDDSKNNIVYNNYFHNLNNARDNQANTWSTTNTTGPNIIGGPYIGGNYWSDYTGNDTNGDGFGETPYNITGDSNKDYLPLIPPPPPPPPPPVGGTIYPMNKLAILAPWIALAVLLAGGLSWLTLRRRRAQS